MDGLTRFCCQNPECTLYARRDAGNLSVCARYGKQDHIRLLYCKACKYRFSERKGTALFHSCGPTAHRFVRRVFLPPLHHPPECLREPTAAA